jgi:PASTA domain
VRVAVWEAIAGREALVAKARLLELERLGRQAKLQVRGAVEVGPEVLQIRLEVPVGERHGRILWWQEASMPWDAITQAAAGAGGSQPLSFSTWRCSPRQPLSGRLTRSSCAPRDPWRTQWLNLREMRALGTVALALLVALCVCAATASAAPLSMTFTEARANVGVQLSDATLFGPPDVAPFSAQIDPASGSITLGALEVPRFSTHITEPIDADVTVDFEIGLIKGSFNQATGALSLNGNAGGTLTATNETFEGEECTVSTEPSPLVLTTAGSSGGTSPRFGAPFTAGLTGPGAIAGEWTDMHAEPVEPGNTENVDFCNNVEGRIGGPGGVWLEQKGSVAPPPPPPPPPPAVCTVPKLAGKTLARAKAALKAANCKLGKVHRPRHLKGRGRLVVKSSNPAAGAKPASGKVNLRLGPKHRKARR